MRAPSLDRVQLRIPAPEPANWPAGVQEQLVDEEPDRFYVPAYVGHRGWIGVRIDRKVDWNEIEQILIDAYTCVAPAKLVAQLDAGTV